MPFVSDLLLALAEADSHASMASSQPLYSSYPNADFLSKMDLIALFKSSFDCFAHCLIFVEQRQMDSLTHLFTVDHYVAIRGEVGY